jgi:hypothetical protein
VPRRPLLAALTLLALAPAAVSAQTSDADRRAVLATVGRLFDGMRKGDSAMVRSAFHPNALLATAMTKDGRSAVQIDTLDAFVNAVGTPHADVWDERLRNTEVRIDGGLASVWTEYDFYAGSKFSHCGVDAFQLVRTGGEWRIIALADTRRQTGCPEPGGH